MCYIFNCFGWTLDLIQRFITFFLACCLCYAICVGFGVALVAGVAYGYNYSLAEFITFTRSDVTVYMKRGQFYDRPDLARGKGGGRRAGGGDVDFFDAQAQNAGIDYNDIRQKSNDVKLGENEVLTDVMKKSKETSNYAGRIVKYEYKPEPQPAEMRDEAVQAQVFTETKSTIEQDELTEPQDYYKLAAQSTPSQSITLPPHGTTMLQLLYTKLLHRTTTTSDEVTTPPHWYNTPKTFIPRKQEYMPAPRTPPRRSPEPRNLEDMPIPKTAPRRTPTPISIKPNPAISTAIYRSGNSPIIMRNFRPIDIVESRGSNSLEDYANKGIDRLGNMELVEGPDNFKPSYFKDFDSSIPRTQFVNRVKPKKKPPSRDMEEQEQENSEEYEESATRVHAGFKNWRQGKKSENYPNEEFYVS